MYIIKKIYLLGVMLMASLTLFSCKSNKTALGVRHLSTPLDSVMAKETKFTYLKSKFKLHFHDAERDVKAKVRLRLKKDSLIWVSITKAGFEGIRGMVTKDSIYLLDRMKKIYRVSDFKTLSKNFNFEINFNILHSLRMVYEDYAAYNDKVFPSKSTITVKHRPKNSKQNLITSISIKYLKVEFTDEKVRFPFRVSKRYTRE